MTRSAAVLALLLALPVAAQAVPPPVGSDDWNVMAPYKDWVEHQHNAAGVWCCDIGDGRPVDARIVGDHWEVHITPAHFPGQPDHWAPVPDDKITHNANPMGVPIVWLNPYTNFTVQCFAPPDGS